MITKEKLDFSYNFFQIISILDKKDNSPVLENKLLNAIFNEEYLTHSEFMLVMNSLSYEEQSTEIDYWVCIKSPIDDSECYIFTDFLN